MVEQINFNDDLSLIGNPGTANLGGSLLFDYPNNFVDGSLTLSDFNGLGPQVFTNLTLTQTGTTLLGLPIYHLSGSNGVAGITIDYTGLEPTTADINVSNLSGASVAASPRALVQSAAIVCFAAGTRIRARRGDVAIEDLRVGEVVRTNAGQWRPIVWTGSRTIDCRTYPEPRAALPIRIAAGAFGAGRPERDLLVSPGHAICVSVVDEILMPAALLVNGTTITQLDVEEVTYWHVELESHDIILAEGLPTESYIDVANRIFFGRGTLDPPRNSRTLADYCRPYVIDEAVLRAVRQRLRARAEALGWVLDTAPFADLHLLADGKTIRPAMDGLLARFELPADAADVWIVSETSIPAHVYGSTDSRYLGICLRGLKIEAREQTREIDLAHPFLCIGFHPAEGKEETACRWTAGRSRLPAALWQGLQGPLTLEVSLAGPAVPRWIAPKVVSTVDDASFASPDDPLTAAA